MSSSARTNHTLCIDKESLRDVHNPIVNTPDELRKRFDCRNCNLESRYKWQVASEHCDPIDHIFDIELEEKCHLDHPQYPEDLDFLKCIRLHEKEISEQIASQPTAIYPTLTAGSVMPVNMSKYQLRDPQIALEPPTYPEPGNQHLVHRRYPTRPIFLTTEEHVYLHNISLTQSHLTQCARYLLKTKPAIHMDPNLWEAALISIMNAMTRCNAKQIPTERYIELRGALKPTPSLPLPVQLYGPISIVGRTNLVGELTTTTNGSQGIVATTSAGIIPSTAVDGSDHTEGNN